MAQSSDATKRENRFHVCLSDAELAAIDRYRFDLRIATRAEAVRRLINLGLPKMEEKAMFARIATAHRKADAERRQTVPDPVPESD